MNDLNMKSKMDMSECPSLGKIALLLEGKLDETECKNILLHIADCNDCAMEYALGQSLNAVGKISKCPSLEKIALLLEGKLDETECKNILLHIADCNDCAMEYNLAKELALSGRDIQSCLTGETITRWLLGQLDDAERRAVMLHTADCKDCAEKITAVFSAATMAAKKKFFIWKALRQAAIVFVVAGIGFVGGVYGSMAILAQGVTRGDPMIVRGADPVGFFLQASKPWIELDHQRYLRLAGILPPEVWGRYPANEASFSILERMAEEIKRQTPNN